ncbi:MAG: TatD family hydrolase [Anaerolineae bacterium]|nr:TatD family hydrolase [Anaerolineae bacterium]
MTTTKDERPTTKETVSSSVFRPSSVIDTHCHLDLRQFDGDREAVIERAWAAGVEIIVNPAIDLASCRRVLALADRYAHVYAAVGVHPNDCGDFNDATLAELRVLAQHPKVVAIGEIGLDYYWEKTPHDQQQRVLRGQLELAGELRLPVILHSRNRQGDVRRQCNADLLDEVRRWRETKEWEGGRVGDRLSSDSCVMIPDPCTGIWHAFSGDFAEAQQAVELGLELGLGGPVTFQNARQLHELAPRLQIDRLVLETDAPYLAPHPRRGQRNEPAYIPLVADKLAALCGTTVQAIAIQTTATARTCFERLA